MARLSYEPCIDTAGHSGCGNALARRIVIRSERIVVSFDGTVPVLASFRRSDSRVLCSAFRRARTVAWQGAEQPCALDHARLAARAPNRVRARSITCFW